MILILKINIYLPVKTNIYRKPTQTDTIQVPNHSNFSFYKNYLILNPYYIDSNIHITIKMNRFFQIMIRYLYPISVAHEVNK